MTLPPSTRRTLAVTPEHLESTRRALASLASTEMRLLVDALVIDELAGRSSDTYIWHMEPGSAYRESPLLAVRMDEAGIDPDARLAHGALGLIHALRVAYSLQSGLPVRGVRDVRYSVPVYEGAHLSVTVGLSSGELSEFAVTTDQLDPWLAITGKLLYGPIMNGHVPSGFAGIAEQQLFTLEETIGLVSATLGLWVLDSGGRVLYMSQGLEIHGRLATHDTLEATAEIVDRQPGRRVGERITARVAVSSTLSGKLVASGESLFLYSEGSM